MTRLIQWISTVVRDPSTEPEVHFHSGPASRAAACYEAHCDRPRLSV